MNNGKITKDNNKVTKTKTTNNNSKKPSSKHLMTGTAIFIAAILVISGTNIKAFADQIGTQTEGPDQVYVDIPSGGVSAVPGQSLNVKYYIIATGGGNPPSCDASDGSSVKFNLQGLTFNPTPSELTFSGCGSSNGQVAQFTIPANQAPGSYSIQLSNSRITDISGTYASGTATFSINVQEPPQPTITKPVMSNVPQNQVVEATSSQGAVVTFATPTASDEQGSVSVSCTPQSGSTFPIDVTTTVSCSATNSAGETTETFTITVQDKTPPKLVLPPAISDPVEGNYLGGAIVTYTASATDIVDGPLPINCNPISGSIFALGTTTVDCDATDAHQNKASGSFSVTVVDTTPPTVNLDQAPPTVTSATGPNGATVQFTVSAQDTVSGPIAPTCDAQSGDTFKVGDTVVKCSATDGVGLTGTLDIPISVQYDRTLFSFPLAPLNKDGSSVYKLNSNIPVQFKGTYADNGGPITTGTFTIKVYKVDNSADGPVNEAVATDAATTGYNFRYTTDGIWKYNLATKTLGAGDYYVLVDFNDGGADASKTITTTSGSPGQVKVGVKK